MEWPVWPVCKLQLHWYRGYWKIHVEVAGCLLCWFWCPVVFIFIPAGAGVVPLCKSVLIQFALSKWQNVFQIIKFADNDKKIHISKWIYIFGVSTFVIIHETSFFSADFLNCNWCRILEQGGKDPMDYRFTNLSWNAFPYLKKYLHLHV